MNNSITTLDYNRIYSDSDDSSSIMIINPISKDLNVMRQSLLLSGLENMSYNINRKNPNLKLYEFGNTYHRIDNNIIERKHLMLLASGNLHIENFGERMVG